MLRLYQLGSVVERGPTSSEVISLLCSTLLHFSQSMAEEIDIVVIG